MRKFLKIMIVTLMLGLQSQKSNAQYLHWIEWTPANHIGTANEFADIFYQLGQGKIVAGQKYRLSTGVIYQVNKPKEYFQQTLECYQHIDNTVTAANLYEKIRNDEEVIWDNNLDFTTKNFYFSSKDNRIKFIDNYSGSKASVHVLLHNGFPGLKQDCGNPQWVYLKTPIAVTPPAPPATKDSVVVNVIRKDSVITTVTRKDSVVTTIKKEDDDYEVEEKVEVPVVNNYTYTTNIYNSPQQGGPRRVHRQTEYYERRTGFQIYAQYRGGGSSTSVTPTRRVTMGQPIGGGTRGVNMGQPISPTRRVYMGQPGG